MEFLVEMVLLCLAEPQAKEPVILQLLLEGLVDFLVSKPPVA